MFFIDGFFFLTKPLHLSLSKQYEDENTTLKMGLLKEKEQQQHLCETMKQSHERDMDKLQTELIFKVCVLENDNII